MSQQDIARAGSIREPVSVEDMMEQALVMAMPEPEKYHMQVVREYSPIPTIMTDRHQVLQVLVNLITNAKNAMVEHSESTRRLTLRLGVPAGSAFARLEVIDTGGGLRPKTFLNCLHRASPRERLVMGWDCIVPPSSRRTWAARCRRRVPVKDRVQHSRWTCRSSLSRLRHDHRPRRPQSSDSSH